jgi:hypothetical protein
MNIGSSLSFLYVVSLGLFFYPEQWGSMCLWNVSKHLPDCVATHHTRQYSSRSLPRELQISHTKKILSCVRGSMTNNNGFWIGLLDLLTPSFTITLNYNQL